jgi:branched-chain amino acid transport system permease protein
MTITGGMGTLFGPILGAVCIILLRDIISNFTESWTFIMGILFMAAVLGFRGGIIGILRSKLKLSI